MTSPLPLRRAVNGRLLGGVAKGLSDLTGLRTSVLRVAFLVLGAAGGVGIAAYLVFWVFLPQVDGRTLREDRRAQVALVVGGTVGTIALVSLLTFNLLPGGSSTVALLAAVTGVVVVWQQADPVQRARWRQSATGTQSALIRFAGGALLLAAGLIGFLASRGQLAVARAGLLSTVVVVTGLALVSSPWWFTMATDLAAERRERIRSQERAEVAAHLHDSVLQTLALIQKSAGSAADVQRLARSQERELRSWLYADRSSAGSLTAALEALAGDVELVHGVPVEIVAVGDVTLDETLTALVAATKEAVVNAAKHSGAAVVDVYVEAEPDQVTVFVRDRGCGFDVAAVSADRHGLSGSIVGRMERHGGTATVRSAPGEGTEIRLELPL